MEVVINGAAGGGGLDEPVLDGHTDDGVRPHRGGLLLQVLVVADNRAFHDVRPGWQVGRVLQVDLNVF